MRLEPVVKEVVWGGRWLADALGRPGAAGARLGESWEAFSGSAITDGEFAGSTIGELFAVHGAAMFGSAAAGCPRFPLLVKFIDACENLSIQVHPNDRLAMEREGYPYGKTEFWYVLEAVPGAEIVYGLSGDSVDRADIGAALAEGRSDIWRRVPVRPGDVVFIPAGTVHALTQGVVVYELQQDCDITYRLYDWGRTGREIHVEKGLQSIDCDSPTREVTRPEMRTVDGVSAIDLAVCNYFRATHYEVSHSVSFPPRADSFVLWTCIDGKFTLSSGESSMTLRRGDTVFVPANTVIALTSAGPTPARLIAAALC